MAIGVFLLWTKKISEGCFLLLIGLGCALLILAPIFADSNDLRVAHLNNNTSQINLLTEKEKTKQLNLRIVIGVFAIVTPLIKLVILLFGKIHFGF